MRRESELVNWNIEVVTNLKNVEQLEHTEQLQLLCSKFYNSFLLIVTMLMQPLSISQGLMTCWRE